MLKKTVYLLLCSLFLGNLLFADINTVPYLNKKMAPPTIQEGVAVGIPKDILKDWKLAYHVVTRDSSIFEWIPKNESIENWSQLIQIQTFVMNKHQSAETFAVNFFQNLKKTLPQVKTNVLQHSPDTVLLEWYLTQTVGTTVAQSELAKIIANDKGVYRIAYTKKVPSLDSNERKQWLEWLNTAKAVPREMPATLLTNPVKK